MSSPNILWICTDQQRFDTLGCYGNENIDTPNIDRLAESGVKFERCYSQSPVCVASRASFMTGRYPRTTRVRQNGQAIPDGEQLVTRSLADAGYNCGLVGKLHLAPSDPTHTERVPMMERRIDDGFSEFHWSHDPREFVRGEYCPTNEYQEWLDHKGVEYEVEPSTRSKYIDDGMPTDAHHTTWAAEQASGFIRRNQPVESPWGLMINFFDPHVPFDPPEEYLAKYLGEIDVISLPSTTAGELEQKPIFQEHPPSAERFPYDEMSERDHRLVRAAYFAMVDLIDDQVGTILDTLESTNQTENTVIIYMSDHGEMLGDHRIYLKGPYFYEPAIRVPLLFSSADRFVEGTEIGAPVELVDLAPTILDLAGIDIPSSVHGTSLRPVLDGEESAPADKTVYCEYYHALEREQFYQKLQQDEYWGQADSVNARFAETFAESDIHPPFKQDGESVDEFVLPYSTMIRTDQYKLIKHHSISTGELYDLDTDPDETENRWNDESYAAVKSDLLSNMTDTMAMTIDPAPDRHGRF